MKIIHPIEAVETIAEGRSIRQLNNLEHAMDAENGKRRRGLLL